MSGNPDSAAVTTPSGRREDRLPECEELLDLRAVPFVTPAILHDEQVVREPLAAIDDVIIFDRVVTPPEGIPWPVDGEAERGLRRVFVMGRRGGPGLCGRTISPRIVPFSSKVQRIRTGSFDFLRREIRKYETNHRREKCAPDDLDLAAEAIDETAAEFRQAVGVVVEHLLHLGGHPAEQLPARGIVRLQEEFRVLPPLGLQIQPPGERAEAAEEDRGVETWMRLEGTGTDGTRPTLNHSGPPRDPECWAEEFR